MWPNETTYHGSQSLSVSGRHVVGITHCFYVIYQYQQPEYFTGLDFLKNAIPMYSCGERYRFAHLSMDWRTLASASKQGIFQCAGSDDSSALKPGCLIIVNW